jgi:hypothetical protein
MRLEELSDVRLLASLDTFVSSQRACMVDIVAHLAELDSRPAVFARGYPSLFQYCLEHLHFSEDEACRRIEAARLSRRFPATLAALAAGNGLGLVQPDPGTTDTSQGAIPVAFALASPPVTDARRSRLEPLSQDRFALQVTISRSLKDELELVRDLMRHRNPNGDLERVLGDAMAALRSKLEKEKLAATAKPRSNACGAPSKKTQATASRRIPAETKRAIVEKEGLRCSFVGIDGRRCACRAFLEYDHVEPVGLDGGHGEDNVRILCRAHNQYAAERIYGRTTMRRWRSSAAIASAVSPPSTTPPPRCVES